LIKINLEASIEFLRNELLKKRIRPSYQRIKVLEYLYQRKVHPTADDIFEFLSAEIPSLSKATIYNTLHSFVEAGLVRVISIDGIEKRYDITIYDHGHFKCDCCGTIFNFAIDIENFPVDELKQFQIKERNVYFNGLCPNCLNQDCRKKE